MEIKSELPRPKGRGILPNFYKALNIIIQSSLIFLLIFTPLALGTTQVWSIFIMRITVIFAFTAWMVKLVNRQADQAIKAEPGTLNVEHRTYFHHTPLDIPILVFLGIAVISTIFISSYKYLSIDWLANLITYAAIYFIIVNNIHTEVEIKWLIRAMLFAGTIVGVYGILRYFGVLDILPHSEDRRISSVYYHPSHYAGFLVMVTPLAVASFLFSKSFWKTLTFGALSALLIVNLALSFSISNLAFVISMIFLLIVILYLREWRVVIKRVLPVIAVFFCLYLFALVSTSPLLTHYAFPTRFGQITKVLGLAINGRIEIWHYGLSEFLERPCFGWGLGLFSDVFSKYRPPTRTNFLNYAHSDYLQIISDMGIIGLGVYLILIGVLLVKGMSLLKHTTGYNRVLAIGVVTALFGAIVRSLWDNNLFLVQSLSVYFFTLGAITMVMKREVYLARNFSKSPKNNFNKSAKK